MKCKCCGSVLSYQEISITKKCMLCGNMIDEKNDTLQSVLNQIFKEFGVKAFQNGKHLLAYFSDLAPFLSEQREALSAFVKCNGHTLMLDIQNKDVQEHKQCVMALKMRLVSEMNVKIALAGEVCRAFLEVVCEHSSHKIQDPNSSRVNLEQKEDPVCVTKVENLAESKIQTEMETMFQKGEENYKSQNYEMAFRYYKKVVVCDHAFAQCRLGMMYLDGLGVDADENMAFFWFLKSAKCQEDFALGKFYVGYCYNFGIGVSENHVEAVRWYRLAAQKGEACAQNNLGVCYENGCGVQQDYAEAAKWYSMAAEQGYAIAQCKLGALYAKGNGVDKDIQRAFSLIHQSAMAGDAYGQYELGNWYLNSNFGMRDEKKAFSFYKSSAEQNHLDAQVKVGKCYELGIGVRKNASQAFSWSKKAYENGSEDAIRNIGECYENGVGVEKDLSKAAKWYRMAVERGDAGAMCSLGVLYCMGNGVPADENEGLRLLEAAYQKGELFSLPFILSVYGEKESLTKDECQKIAELAYSMHMENAKSGEGYFSKMLQTTCLESCVNVACHLAQTTETNTLGIEMILELAELGNVSAQLWLAQSYEDGSVVAEDMQQAIFWYDKAAKQEDKVAQKRLNKLLKKINKNSFWK